MPTTTMEYTAQKYTCGYSKATNMLEVTEHANLCKQAFIGAIIDNATSQTLEYCHFLKMHKYHNIWKHSFANELGRLAQGIRGVKGTNTIKFIMHYDMPNGKSATCG